jgi:4-amino-4-deoxy-L-arabinose transferase-like glycosyltransferase
VSHTDVRDRSPLTRRYSRVLLAAIVALAIGLRLVNISEYSAWEDEAATINYARLPLGTLAGGGFDPGNPSGYYLLIKAWMALFGQNELGLRLLSVAFGVATIPAVFALARRISGSAAVGLAAGLLLACSARHIYYSQEIRAYALLLLLATTSTHALINALQKGGRRRWIVYIALAWYMPYIHFQGYVVLLAQGVAGAVRLLAFPTRARMLTGFLLSEIALLLLNLWGFRAYLQPGLLTHGGYYYWQGYLTADGFADLLAMYTVRAPHFLAACVHPGILGRLVNAGYGVVAALPLLFAWLLRRRLQPLATTVCLTTLYAGPAAFMAVCLFKPVYQPKYLLAFQPLYLATICSGLLLIPRRRRVWRAAAILIVALSFLPSVAHDITNPWRPDYRGAARYVLEKNPDGHTRVHVYQFAWFAFQRYYPYKVYHGADPEFDDRSQGDEAVFLARVVRETRRHGRSFAVISGSQCSCAAQMTRIEQHLRHHLTLRSRKELRNLVVLELAPPSTESRPASQPG